MRAAVVVGMGLCLACGPRESPDASGGRRPAPAVSVAKTAPEPISTRLAPPRVALLDAGQSPHQKLRFDPVLGEGSLALTLASTAAIDMGIAAIPPTQVPDLRLTLATQTRAGDAGNFVLRLETSAVEAVSTEGASPALAAGLAPTIAALEELEVELVLDGNGALLEASLRVPEQLGEDAASHVERLRNAFAQMFVTFPDEPIGVGARWMVTTQLDLVGARIEQSTAFSLRQIDGDQLTIDLAFTQQAATPSATAPAPEPSAIRVSLDELRTTGAGQMRLDRRALAPAWARSTSHSELVQTIERDGQRQQVVLSLDLSIEAQGTLPDAP